MTMTKRTRSDLSPSPNESNGGAEKPIEKKPRDFLGPILSDQNASFGFIKRVTAISVSTIFYYRGFFEKDDYGFMMVDGKNYHLLSRGSAKVEVKTIIELLGGVFEAIEKKYLKTLVIGLHRDPDDIETVVEAYFLRYKYEADGEPSMSIRRKTGAGDGKENSYDSDLFDQTVKLNAELKEVVQSLKTLPDDPQLYLRFKLTYNDAAPKDYNPVKQGSYFELKTGKPDLQLFGDPNSSKCDGIQTKYHQLSLNVVFNQEEVIEDEQ